MKKKKSIWKKLGVRTKVRNLFQVLGTGASVVLGAFAVFGGVGQTMLPTTPTMEYLFSSPFKIILYSALGMTILVSFLIVFIANRSAKRKR